MFSLAWSGVEAFNRGLATHIERASEGSRLFVSRGLHLAEARMKEHAGEGGRHAAGTPTPAMQGSGPAVITGTLRRSIGVGPLTEVGRGRWQGEVGPRVIYGRRIELEYNYPYAGPGWDDAKVEFPALSRATWQEVIFG